MSIGEVKGFDHKRDAVVEVRQRGKPVVLKNSANRYQWEIGQIVFFNEAGSEPMSHAMDMMHYMNRGGDDYRPANPVEIEAYRDNVREIDLVVYDEDECELLVIGKWSYARPLTGGGVNYISEGFFEEVGWMYAHFWADSLPEAFRDHPNLRLIEEKSEDGRSILQGARLPVGNPGRDTLETRIAQILA